MTITPQNALLKTRKISNFNPVADEWQSCPILCALQFDTYCSASCQVGLAIHSYVKSTSWWIIVLMDSDSEGRPLLLPFTRMHIWPSVLKSYFRIVVFDLTIHCSYCTKHFQFYINFIANLSYLNSFVSHRCITNEGNSELFGLLIKLHCSTSREASFHQTYETAR